MEIDRLEIINGTMTKRKVILTAITLAILLAAGVNSFAQVRRIQMHIGGYLCGIFTRRERKVGN